MADIINYLSLRPDLLAIIIPLFLFVIIWSLIWKGLALWKAARMNSKPWFVVLLIVNTLGILEILYIYVFSEMRNKRNSKVR